MDAFEENHLRESYESHKQVITGDIPDIDIVLLQDGAVRRLADATAAGAYDWIIASHVIEHVPDLIDWLSQAAEITADDGALILAVPDRRYTFDLHRPPTSVGQILQAHELEDDRPSTRALFDHFRSHVTVPAPRLCAAPSHQDLGDIDAVEGRRRRRSTVETDHAVGASIATSDYSSVT